MSKIWSVFLLFLPPFVQAGDCNDADVAPLVTSFFDAAASIDCRVRLNELDVDRHWVNQCQRQEGPHGALYLAFAERTRVETQRVDRQNGKAVAVLAFEGPDPQVFGIALVGLPSCADESESLFGPSSAWPADFKPKPCDDGFFADIPTIRYEGLMPLACRDGTWFVGAPEAEDGQTLTDAGPTEP